MNNYWLNQEKQAPLYLGDMRIEDSGQNGFDIFVNDKKVCFINSIGEEALLHWLMEKQYYLNRRESE